ncbi:MAG: DedA family protein [Hyphomicrobium sp.]|nr:DedA family protein [Hyphomicrobium sp.]
MPTEETWNALLAFMRDNAVWLEGILFILALAESIIVASVFIPSSLIFVTVGALEGAAQGPLIPLVAAGALGALAGDLISFALGYRLRGHLDTTWPLRDYREPLDTARRFFARWGVFAIVASKLSGPLRPIIPMLAGASTMSGATFLAASAVSSVIWAVVVLVPSYYGLQWLMQ